MKILIILGLMASLSAYAEDKPCKEAKTCCNAAKDDNNNNNNNNINVNVNQKGPKVITNTVIKYVDRIVYVDKYVPVNNEKIIEKTQIVKIPVVKLKIKKVEVVRYKTKVKKYVRKVYVQAPRNTLNLLLGRSKTHINDEDNGPYSKKLSTDHENDIGLHYQHRFGDTFTLGGMGTVQENYYLTIGLGW